LDSGYLWNVFLNVCVNFYNLLRKILSRRNYCILPYIPVTPSNIALSCQVVCHYREIFHVYLSALSLRMCSVLEKIF
ncbi:hypothetical protein DBV15_04582, partial [Temnothorax longispinosus]